MSREVTVKQVGNGYILMFDDESEQDFEKKTEVYESFRGVGERLSNFFDYRCSGLIRSDLNEEI